MFLNLQLVNKRWIHNIFFPSSKYHLLCDIHRNWQALVVITVWQIHKKSTYTVLKNDEDKRLMFICTILQMWTLQCDVGVSSCRYRGPCTPGHSPGTCRGGCRDTEPGSRWQGKLVISVSDDMICSICRSYVAVAWINKYLLPAMNTCKTSIEKYYREFLGRD